MLVNGDDVKKRVLSVIRKDFKNKRFIACTLSLCGIEHCRTSGTHYFSIPPGFTESGREEQVPIYTH